MTETKETTQKTTGEEASEEYLKRKNRTRWSCCLVAGMIPFGLILLLFLGFFLWKTRSRSALKELEDEIAKRGEALTIDDMYDMYQAGDDVKDKTDLFLALMPALRDETFNKEQMALPIVGEGAEFSVDPDDEWEQQEEVRAFFDQHADLMDSIEHAALAEGEVRFPLRFEDGIGMLLENTQQMRSIARLLDLQARLQAREGKDDEAHRSVLAMFGAAEAVKHEPILVSQLIYIALRAVAQNTTRELLPECDWTDEQIQQLIDECQNPDWRMQLKDAMIGERALSRTVFENPAGLGPDIASVRLITSFEDERFYIDYMTKCVAATEKPFPEVFDELERLEAELTNTTQFQQISRPITMLMAPAIATASFAFARALAADRATAAHLAIELYRRKHGKPPAALEDLVPEFLAEVPIDPFSPNRQPLIYRVDPTEIVIYTVYQNQTDDGGDDTDLADFVWRVKLKKKP